MKLIPSAITVPYCVIHEKMDGKEKTMTFGLSELLLMTKDFSLSEVQKSNK